MQKFLSRRLVPGLLIGWALCQASALGQTSAGRVTLAEKLRPTLDTPVSLDYTAQSLSDAINHFRDQTGISIVMDQAAMQMEGYPAQLTLKAKNEKAGQVLRKLLNRYSLRYVVQDGGDILVTTEEMATARQYLRRVNVELEEVPLKKAVREFARSQGINVVIDSRLPATESSDAPVSLRLDNVSVETTLRLLAECASLKAVRMGNVTYITSEDRAKKIRDEEASQLDNPFNGNMPAPNGPPMPMGAWAGAAGVNAVPARVVPVPPPGMGFGGPMGIGGAPMIPNRAPVESPFPPQQIPQQNAPARPPVMPPTGTTTSSPGLPTPPPPIAR